MPASNSATTAAAILMFDLYDITQDNSSFTFMPLADAVHELQAGHFDAGVFMLAPENPVVRALASDLSLHLLAVSEGRAITNHLAFLRPVVLPRGIYNIADAIPPNDTPMVAAPVSVVARESLHPYLLYSLLEAMATVHRPATFLGGAGEFPTPVGSQLPVHPLAVEYYGPACHGPTRYAAAVAGQRGQRLSVRGTRRGAAGGFLSHRGVARRSVRWSGAVA